MNTLKFQNIREKRHELFNLEDYKFNEFCFDKKETSILNCLK